jgi:hypothetical protein
MNAMRPAWVVFVACGALLVGGAAGYFLHARQSRAERLDILISDLASNILVMDAVEAEIADTVHPVLTATIERDYEAVVRIVGSGEAPKADRLFCEISRRVRVAKESGRMFSNGEATGFDVQLITDFLSTRCPGNPKRRNWAIVSQ